MKRNQKKTFHYTTDATMATRFSQSVKRTYGGGSKNKA
jgi:hypothetical protein